MRDPCFTVANPTAAPLVFIEAYLEDHPRTDGYVVNNHGDRVRPLTGVMGPLINGRTSWLINGGDPNYLLTGMILQVRTFI